MGEPNMKGSTGLLELGVSWQAQKAWTFDANLRGMAGKHERVTGMVRINMPFKGVSRFSFLLAET